MTEECQNCRKEVKKYIILDIAEFQEKEEEVEGTNYENVTLCKICWMDLKKNS
ncbi:MAG TPA: hypothetical protein VFY41_02090 [Nitrososphaeraceae archaeon]|nr:hypothetical protein [Nitrososphaeraceae archaeon]